jgi:integrase/recombinase XerD
MSPRRQHRIAALHLSGQSERTQASSVRAVRLRAQCSHPSPDRLSAQELQRSCLHSQNVDGLAPAAMRICSSGMRFCSQHVLQRDWSTLARRRAHTTHHLPAVLRVEAGRRLLAAATPCHTHVSCTTVYSLGLRLHAALFLPVAASDGPRLQGQVQRGTGATDRYVPLPAETLALLRTSWQTPRHPTWLFPATGRAHPPSPTAASPRRRSRVQGAFRTATQRGELTKTGVAIPPLRHASATPRLEAGVPPRLRPRSLGHTPRDTTRLALPLTHPGQAAASERRTTLMPGLRP